MLLACSPISNGSISPWLLEVTSVIRACSSDCVTTQNYAAEIKIRAERRAGEMLAGMEKNKGGQSSTSRTTRPVTLEDLGIKRPIIPLAARSRGAGESV